MTKLQLQEILSTPFELETWRGSLTEIFNIKHFHQQPQQIILPANDKAETAFELGSFETEDDRLIGLYQVNVLPGVMLERNKVGLRGLLRNVYKYDVDGALIVFAQDEKWRFSYVSEIRMLDENGFATQSITNPKRFTYLFGPGESCRTAAERFQLLSENRKINLKDIQEAFSVEKISKQFFREYKEHYSKFVDYLDGSKYKITAFNNDEKAIRDFCKKLLGRIVFLYFLQKKGWLGVPVNGKWGEGDPAFLKNLFWVTGANQSFYAAALTTLFFDTLNTVRENHLCEFIDGKPCRIPYLNGGLFEKESDKFDFLTFSPQLFTDLFSFFDSYNFTIYEDSPEEHTMAVDPEMLGHIFENLLEDNKDKGAYYTPKEIVHYMTQESLIEYLFTGLNTEHVQLAPDRKTRDLFVKGEQAGMTFDRQKDNISREDIEHFIKQKETTYYIVKNAAKIGRLLDNVKICDPAIGSGAFPMGLLHEIYSAKQVLFSCHSENHDWNPARVKENIIQNSIYGVDIEKGAVDIARLRFWLSLIVDEDTPRALPNLDYKIVVGNSLVPKFEEEVIEIDWDLKSSVGKADEYVKKIQSLLKQIVSKQRNYFNPGGDKQKQKQEIRNLKIELLITQLTLNKYRYQTKNPFSSSFAPTAKDRQKDLDIKMTLAGFDKNIAKLKTLLGNDKPFDHFDWKLDFPDVMNENVAKDVGFDIVIGNPPYLEARSSSFSGAMKNECQIGCISRWNDDARFITRGSDLLIYFFELCFYLMNKTGSNVFITQNSWLDTEYGKKFQEFILKKVNVVAIIDSDYKYFDSQDGPNINTIITIFSSINENNEKIIFSRFYNNFSDIPYSLSKIEFLKENGFGKIDIYRKSEKLIHELKWGILLSSDTQELNLFKLLNKTGLFIDQIPNSNLSIGQGLNIDKSYTVDKIFLKANPQYSKAIIPFLTNKDGAIFNLLQTEKYILDKSKLNRIEISNLRKLKVVPFDKRKTRKIIPKLILPRGIGRHFCCINEAKAYSASFVEIYDNNNNLNNNTLYNLWLFLNSSVAWLIREIGGRKNLGGGMLKAEAIDLKYFPLYFDFNNHAEIKKIFDRINQREALSPVDEIESFEHKSIDNFVFDFLNIGDKDRDHLISNLKNKIIQRSNKSRT